MSNEPDRPPVVKVRKRGSTASRKSDVIEALCYTGKLPSAFLVGAAQVLRVGDGTGAIVIKTPEDDVRVDIGDWIIKSDAKGEFSAYKPYVFAASYEPVDPPPHVEVEDQAWFDGGEQRTEEATTARVECPTCKSDNPKVCASNAGYRHPWRPTNPHPEDSLFPHYCCGDKFHTRPASPLPPRNRSRRGSNRRTFQTSENR